MTYHRPMFRILLFALSLRKARKTAPYSFDPELARQSIELCCADWDAEQGFTSHDNHGGD